MRYAAIKPLPVLCLCAAAVFGAETEARGLAGLLSATEDWRWVALGADSGLPSLRVLSITSDGDGIIWAGTDRGLVVMTATSLRRRSRPTVAKESEAGRSRALFA